jgi:hypothetical protein
LPADFAQLGEYYHEFEREFPQDDGDAHAHARDRDGYD